VIVRILDDAQYEIPEAAEERLIQLDAVVDRALEANDEEGFHRALAELTAAVRASGTPVDPATILPSDLVLPHDGASLSEVHDLLASEADS
jgi:hypothetical protein